MVRPWPHGAAELAEGALVIADLHLDPGGDERVDEFVAWVRACESDGVPSLLILGDLFDVWVGPAQGRLSGSAAVMRELSRLPAVSVVPGNRDFLLDETFELATGCSVFREGFLAQLGGHPGRAGRVAFVHGDQFCTRDIAYQRMKRVLRSTPVLWLAPRLPLPVARWAAGHLRGASRRAIPRKPPENKAMQPGPCLELARTLEARTVVCGHAHRFHDERLADGTRWIVLDAWGGERDTLRVAPGGELEALHHAAL